MAKGSVRKKGKKWYYRFYVENESGKQVQKEYVGTESKSETEALLRKAMEEYESTKFVAKASNITLSKFIDIWVEEWLKPSSLSNGTVDTYERMADRIKRNPIANRKLQSITTEHLQKYLDSLIYEKGLKEITMRKYFSVLNDVFQFAVYPKKLISYNPMLYVIKRSDKKDVDLFDDYDEKEMVITEKQFDDIVKYLKDKNNPSLLPIQISYYTGLRLGEVLALTWSDVNFDEQYITVRRSQKNNQVEKRVEIGSTKRNKVRIVYFCDTLKEILKSAKSAQSKNKLKYGELYTKNCYKQITEKSRTYYELFNFNVNDDLGEEFIEIDFVCTREDGHYIKIKAVASICRSLQTKVDGLDGFHFHTLRHTYTSNLLAHGAAPKDVQELLGHSNISTTMNVYAHSNQDSKRNTAKLLDKAVG